MKALTLTALIGICQAQTPLAFVPVTPCRVMDTRSTQPFKGAFGPPAIAAYGTARQVPIPTSACGIPVTAGAYSLNITAVPSGPLSFLVAWPAGQPYPMVSTLNSPSGDVVANAAIVQAGASGAIQLIAGNATDVVIDINGYYIPAVAGPAGAAGAQGPPGPAGPQGPAGPGPIGVLPTNTKETPAGAINGINTTFTLSTAPLSAFAVNVHLNGILETPAVDYTITGSIITFLPVSIPQTGDILQAEYWHL